MIIIAEKLNSSVPKTLEALNSHDSEYFIETIKKQSECGADYVDINTALTGEKEIENMKWLIELVLQNSACGIMLDSPNPDVIINCLPFVSNRKIIINSITLSDKYDALIDAAKSCGAGIVCLPIADRKIPETAQQRLENAAKIIEKLRKKGIDDKNIFIDILVEAVATNENAGTAAIETVRLISSNYKNVNTVCGLSNVSFGLPSRASLNSSFLSMLLATGLTSAIMDAASPKMIQAVNVSRALLGLDEYCMDYITSLRS